MKSARSSDGNALLKACSRQGGRVLSISKFSCSAILTNEFRSAECSQPQPRSKVTSGDAMMVWARPPTRSRASSTISERPELCSARGAGADDGDIDFGGEGGRAFKSSMLGVEPEASPVTDVIIRESG